MFTRIFSSSLNILISFHICWYCGINIFKWNIRKITLFYFCKFIDVKFRLVHIQKCNCIPQVTHKINHHKCPIKCQSQVGLYMCEGDKRLLYNKISNFIVKLFVCLYTHEFWLSLCKIVRNSIILLLPLF